MVTIIFTVEKGHSNNIYSIKSSDAIGRAQYIINGNGPLLLIFLSLKLTNIYTQNFGKHNLLYHRGRDEVVRDF